MEGVAWQELRIPQHLPPPRVLRTPGPTRNGAGVGRGEGPGLEHATALDLSDVPPAMIEIANGIVLLIAILLYNTKENIHSSLLADESA